MKVCAQVSKEKNIHKFFTSPLENSFFHLFQILETTSKLNKPLDFIPGNI